MSRAITPLTEGMQTVMHVKDKLSTSMLWVDQHNRNAVLDCQERLEKFLIMINSQRLAPNISNPSQVAKSSSNNVPLKVGLG